LITDKTRPGTPRLEVLARLAQEIAAAQTTAAQTTAAGPPLVIGHGSGSFGHVAAKKHGTRQGVAGPEAWNGFVEVWREANALNRMVVDALLAAGLPVMAFPPSAMVTASRGEVAGWDISALELALTHRLIPVIQGDVIFDTTLGGTILSTEDLFVHLAGRLRPRRILLAGIEAGVWADFPACQRLVSSITPANLSQVAPALASSHATDVTGGMASKVQTMVNLVQNIPGLRVSIFSGERPGAVQTALLGDESGTVIHL